MTTSVFYLTQATSEVYSPSALGYVSNLGEKIITIAGILDISAGSIAGAMAEENTAYDGTI